MPTTEKKSCRVLIADAPAFRKQTAGIAQALGIPFEEKIVGRKKPWCWLPKRLYFRALKQLTKQSTPLTAPWPDVVVACGQNTISFALAIRRANKGNTKLIYIQKPSISPKQFDLVIAPMHDHVKGPHVIETFGATHDLSQTALHEACKKFSPLFERYKLPFISIFIGGASKQYPFTGKQAALLADTIIDIANHYHGSLLISTSRRTGDDNCRYLARRFQAYKNIYFYNGAGDNPYTAMLALAEMIMVTDDSVSMISEACYTGVPVYLLALPEQVQRKKIGEFIDEAIERQLVRYYQGSLDTWDKQPLDEVQRILPELIKAL